MSPIQVDPFSLIPLRIETFYEESQVADGTGFIVEHDGRKFLITNWHNFSGRHPETKACISPTLSIPNKIKISLHVPSQLGVLWQVVLYDLLRMDGSPRWREHQLTNGDMADVAALEIEIPEGGGGSFPLNLDLRNTDLVVSPAGIVSVIGFPDKVHAQGLPIWKVGHVASDIGINYSQKPLFLIDTSTKPGMSGSPVIAKSVGSHNVAGGVVLGGTRIKFMGVYSGRISDGDPIDLSNLGRVWKPDVLDRLLT